MAFRIKNNDNPKLILTNGGFVTLGGGLSIDNGVISATGTEIIIDSTVSDTSTNAVLNLAITNFVKQQISSSESDWEETDPTKSSYINNKPNFATVATSGSYNDLTDKPTIPAAQINADWNASEGVSLILNKPAIPTEDTISGWGFTKNAYVKPNGGIPSTDLSDEIQTILGKADTALQSSDLVLSDDYQIATVGEPLAVGDTYEEAFGKIEKVIEDNELVISLSLNDLNTRLLAQADEIDYLNTSIPNINDTISGINDSISDINTDISGINDDISGINGNITDINTSITEFEQIIEDMELVISSSLNDLNDRKADRSELKTVAFTGSYNDLSDKPSTTSIGIENGYQVDIDSNGIYFIDGSNNRYRIKLSDMLTANLIELVQ